MSIIITIFICIQLCCRISAVLCNIGCCRIRALCNRPAAGAVGVNPNIVSGLGIVQRIALRQNTGCNNISPYIRCAVQKHLAVNDRVGHGHLVGKGAGLAGGLVYDDLAVFIHKIEGIAYVGALPCKHGGYGVLFGFITQPVGVVQCGALIGRIGARLARALHGAGQIDIVAHGQLRGLDRAHLPVEGLGRQHIGGTGGGTVSLGAGGNVHTINGNTIGIGVVNKVFRVDDALDTSGLRTVGKDIDVFADLIGVSLGAGIIEGHGFQDGVGSLAVTDHVGCNQNAVHRGANLRRLIDIVGDDFDCWPHLFPLGGVRIVVCIHDGLHLQVVIIAHLIHEAGVVGRVGDLRADGVEGVGQFVSGGDLVVVLLLAGQRGDGLVHALLGDVGIRLGVEGDGEHLGAQTGDHVHVFLTCGNAQSVRLADNFIGLVRVALDGVGHTVFVSHAVAVVVDFVIVVGVLSAVQVAGQIGSIPCTGDPVVPQGRPALRVVVVPLHSCTVRHEDNIQIAIFAAACFLDGGTHLVDGVEGVVVVGTGGIVQGVRRSQILNGNECTCAQRTVAGVNLRLAVSGIRNTVGHHVCRVTVIGCAGYAVASTIEAVEVGDGHAQIQLLAVCPGGLELRNQVGKRLLKDLRTSFVRAGNGVSCHGGRGIQHDDNVSALLDGHAGGGQLHLGDTGSLEVDAGTGLVDLHGALIGILGVVIDNTGFHLDLDSAQHLAQIADLHPVGAGGVTVEGVLPLPGQIGVCDLGLAGAILSGGGVAGDTGLDSSQRLGSGAALRHGVNGVALDQRIDGAGRGAAGGAGVLVEADTGGGRLGDSPATVVNDVPVGAVNIVNIVDTIAVVIHLELNGISGAVTDTAVLLIQILGSVALGDQFVTFTVERSLNKVIFVIAGVYCSSITTDSDGMGSTV